ncbi:MAG TPA: monovalent cation/H(+) antiporter subunit G [Gemmatimonadales bacterium]|nr:monovalent cation/H(+) antiporter subunit G [Gemmatimonadales bacterium]
MSPQELIATVLLGTGISFVAVGAIGFVRLPDVFCRLHVTGVMDTLGAPLILLGVAVQLGAQLVSLKLLLVIVFLVLSSPLVGHLLARAALEAGHRPQRLEDEFEISKATPEEGGR